MECRFFFVPELPEVEVAEVSVCRNAKVDAMQTGAGAIRPKKKIQKCKLIKFHVVDWFI